MSGASTPVHGGYQQQANPQSRVQPAYRMSGSAMAPAQTAQQKGGQSVTPQARAGGSQQNLQRIIAPLPDQRARAPRSRLYSEDGDPIEPYKPIARSQAIMTTYPSRLRLGVTTLMQPINVKAQALAAKEAAKIDYGAGKRQRTQINYAEVEALDDLEVDSGNESSAAYNNIHSGSGTTARQRSMQNKKQAEMGGSATPTAKAPLTAQNPNAPPKPVAPDRSYLGQQPPGNMVLIEPARRSRHVYPTQQALEDQALLQSQCIPIRVDIDTETHRIRDNFVWDASGLSHFSQVKSAKLKETSITPEMFAEIFCDDAGLPPNFREQVAVAIRTQLDEYSPVAEIPAVAENEKELIDLRVIVNIDVQIQSLRVVDKLEWDLSSGLTPEAFAASLCTDLGLAGEAAPLISHAVHEEIIKHKKECIENGLIGRAEGEERPNQKGPKKMEGIWRDWNDAANFGPFVEELGSEDLEKLEIERERQNKRVRRVAMPAPGSMRLTRPKR